MPPRCPQMPPDASRCLQMLPRCFPDASQMPPRRLQMSPDASQMPSRCLQWWWWWWWWWTFAYKHLLDIYIPTYTQKYNMTHRQGWITRRFTITSFLHNEIVVTKWHTWRRRIFTITSFCTIILWAKWDTYTFAPWKCLKRGGESLSWNAVIYHHEISSWYIMLPDAFQMPPVVMVMVMVMDICIQTFTWHIQSNIHSEIQHDI